MKDFTVATSYGIESCLCLNTNSLRLQSAEQGSMYRTISMFFITCSGTDCESQTAIEDYLKATYFEIYFVDSFYDASDDANPIKQFIPTKRKISISPYDSFDLGIEVVPTEVNFLNNTKKIIFKTGNVYEQYT